jgi:hypothetical protein
MLYEMHPDCLRLFRKGDFIDPGRRSSRPSKNIPKWDEIPADFRPLLDWYAEWSRQAPPIQPCNWEDDPLIRLIGSGKRIWADEHADAYVNRLREETA